jgi:hypothetical protein
MAPQRNRRFAHQPNQTLVRGPAVWPETPIRARNPARPRGSLVLGPGCPKLGDMSGIAKQVTRRRLSDADSDVAFWRTRPLAERVAQVELLRAEYHGWDHEAGPGLQRVHRVLRRP